MRDDRELLYATGEMTEAEAAAFESGLSADERRQAEALRAAFADLRAAKDEIPAPQISFDRVRHAIETAGPAPTTRIWPWQKWFWIAAPTAAAVLTLAALWPRGDLAEPGVSAFSAPEQVASAPAPSAESAPESTSAPSAASLSEPPRVAVVEPESEPAVIRAPDSRPQPRTRRSARRLVADLGSRLPRSSAGLEKAAPVQEVAPMTAPMDFGSNDANGTGLPAAARSGPGGEVPGNPGRSEDTVVVVTRSEDTATGASAAMEVKRDDDVVLGG